MQSNNHLNAKTLSNAAQTSQPTTTTSSQPLPAPQQPLNQLTTLQYTAAATTTPANAVVAANTQLSTKTTLTTSTKATCTSSNENNNNRNSIQQTEQQQQQVTFTILIAIEKSQHLCVIDLISQSLKLLTRHIAYCELLAICLDTNLLPTSNKNVNSDDSVAVTASSSSVSSSTAELTENQKTTDSNGNHCSNKVRSHQNLK